MTTLAGRVTRTSEMLPDNAAVQTAFMSWLETVIGREERTYGIVSGLEHSKESRFSYMVWADHDLVGAALATEIFTGGEWLLTTYVLNA